MSPTKLLIVVASVREGRAGAQIAEWATARAREHGGFDVRVADLAEIALPFHDEPAHPSTGRYTREHTKAWAATVGWADAFVFVMPEYNHSFSAPLKNAIDYLHKEWQYKPVGFVAYGMASSGLRAVTMLKSVVTTLNLFPVNDIVAIPLRQRRDAGGNLLPDDTMERGAKAMFDEISRLAPALAPLRTA